MFSFSSDQTVIPSLSFSKAELLYAIAYLMKDIPNSDTDTRIEMVELKHYLTLIHDKVLLAAYDGSLNKIGIELPPEPSEAPEAKKTAIPPMTELKGKFPTLSEEEILEIWNKADEEREKQEENNKSVTPPPPPSFVIKKNSNVNHCTRANTEIENSKKFASLLGS